MSVCRLGIMPSEQAFSFDDLQRIPLVLRRTRHWVVWRYEDNPGKSKPDKVPYNPRSRSHEHPWHASVSRPRSWGSFGEAVLALQSGQYTGIGFVFHENDSFCGIDLDHCLDEGTHQLTVWAQDIVVQIDSYSEWSPSGTGIHILAEATLPVPGINRKGVGLEMYTSGRFFTITGRHLAPSPVDIFPRQAAVTSLYLAYVGGTEQVHTEQDDTPHSRSISISSPVQEGASPVPVTRKGQTGSEHTLTTPDDLTNEELLEKAMNLERADGRDFAQLWRGDRSHYVHRHGDLQGQIDESLADYALCRMLAFWTGKNALRMDELFRQSGLMRQKWDAPSGRNETYGQRTIARARANCRRTYDPTWKPKQRERKKSE